MGEISGLDLSAVVTATDDGRAVVGMPMDRTVFDRGSVDWAVPVGRPVLRAVGMCNREAAEVVAVVSNLMRVQATRLIAIAVIVSR